MSDNAVYAILIVCFFLYFTWLICGDDILEHRRQMKQLEIDKIREERKLLETKQNNTVTDLRKPQ